MNHQIRSNLKREIRPLLFKNWWKFVLIYLPFVIFYIIYSTSSKISRNLQKVQFLTSKTGITIILAVSLIAIISYVASRYSAIGIQFKIIDIIRYNGMYNGLKEILHNKNKLKMPQSKAYGLKSSGDVLKEHRFWSVFGVGFYKALWTVLWILPALVVFASAWFMDLLSHSYLMLSIKIIPAVVILAIPCFIKNNYSYCMAQYIYRDLDNAGKPINCRDSVSLSRILFNHHKWNYMLLQLSFWDWLMPPALISAGITYLIGHSIGMTILVGTTAFFIVKIVLSPYIKIMELIFYQMLISNRAQMGDKIYQQIDKEISREQAAHDFN